MSDTPLVWYVAYGSNLLTDRMLAYLVGCGDDRPWGPHWGARDPAPPLDDRRVEVTHPEHVAGTAAAACARPRRLSPTPCPSSVGHG